MKKILIVCLLGVPSLSGWVLAQSSGEAEVPMPTKLIGGVSEGKPGPPLPPRVLPNYKIHRQYVHQKSDHKVIQNRVEPVQIVKQPIEPLSEEERLRRNEEWEKHISDIKESGGFFMVSATIYDHKATRVRWRHEGQEFVAWSNVDWNHLGGFIEFEGRGKRFNMFLFSGNTSMKSLEKDLKAGYRDTLPEIPRLPRLSKRGAAYMVMKGDEQNDAAMEFMEAIHDLYDEHRPTLVRAYREREKNHQIYRRKQEDLRRNPPPKPDVIINYWKMEPTRKSSSKRGEAKK